MLGMQRKRALFEKLSAETSQSGGSPWAGQSPVKRRMTSSVIQGVTGKDESVHLLQPLLIDVGDKCKVHEFLYVPNCDCNLLGGDLMAKLGMQINITKR